MLNNAQMTVAAALLATSNLGMDLPDTPTVEEAMAMPTHDLAELMTRFAGHYAETDEDFETFMGEAADWLTVLARDPSLDRFPDIAALVGAEETVVRSRRRSPFAYMHP